MVALSGSGGPHWENNLCRQRQRRTGEAVLDAHAGQEPHTTPRHAAAPFRTGGSLGFLRERRAPISPSDRATLDTLSDLEVVSSSWRNSPSGRGKPPMQSMVTRILTGRHPSPSWASLPPSLTDQAPAAAELDGMTQMRRAIRNGRGKSSSWLFHYTKR